MKPEPDNNFCLKFCKFGGKLLKVFCFDDSVCCLILYLGLYRDLISVFVIY